MFESIERQAILRAAGRAIHNHAAVVDFELHETIVSVSALWDSILSKPDKPLRERTWNPGNRGGWLSARQTGRLDRPGACAQSGMSFARERFDLADLVW
jgi:hypothetical protein